MYSLPYVSGVDKFKAADGPQTGPAFYHATFTVDKVGGTFLDLSNWSFGVVWVNGHNLGRFWDRGPVRSLFVPSQWLKKGKNDITVLELHDAPKTAEITGGKNSIVQEAAVPFAVKLDKAPLSVFSFVAAQTALRLIINRHAVADGDALASVGSERGCPGGGGLPDHGRWRVPVLAAAIAHVVGRSGLRLTARGVGCGPPDPGSPIALQPSESN